VIRADGIIPSFPDMLGLFADKAAIESIVTNVALPHHPGYFGSVIQFRNIGQYNEARDLARNGGIIDNVYYYL
jgi:hypothetical protein